MTSTAPEKKADSQPTGFARHMIASGFFTAYLGFLRLLSRLEMRKAVRLSRAINPLFASPVRNQRRNNIALLFPESDYTAVQRAQIERNHLEYLARIRAEMAHVFLSMTLEVVRSRTSLSGREHLEGALKKGKGVLIVEGHYGHWNSTPAMLQASGYSVTAVVNPNPLKGANFRILHESASKNLGVKLAFVGQDAYSSARTVFKNNGIFYLNFDVAVRTKHTKWFPFGTAAILADLGPAIMALRNRVPVLFAQSKLTDCGTEIALLPAADASNEFSEKAAPETLMRSWINQFYNQFKMQPEDWWAINYITLADHSVLQHSEPEPADAAQAIKEN